MCGFIPFLLDPSVWYRYAALQCLSINYTGTILFVDEFNLLGRLISVAIEQFNKVIYGSVKENIVAVLYGRSRCKGPTPGSGSTLDKTDEILNDILFVCSNID